MKRKLYKLESLIEKIKNDITLPILSDFLDWFYEKLNLHFNKSTPKLIPKKWDIYFVNLWQNIWSELNKTRPCIIWSVKKANFWNTVIIIPLKSFKGQKLNDFQVLIKKSKINWLEKDSIIDFSSIRQISKKRLLNKIWKLDKFDLEKLDKWLNNLFWLK